ncbi:483_t:CDS:2, partial [Dentiscutata heterogama]
TPKEPAAETSISEDLFDEFVYDDEALEEAEGYFTEGTLDDELFENPWRTTDSNPDPEDEPSLELNAVTTKDVFSLPRINDLLEVFGRAAWFTSLDLLSGYWQVTISEKDREKTAFGSCLALTSSLSYRLVSVTLPPPSNFLGHVIGRDGVRPDDGKDLRPIIRSLLQTSPRSPAPALSVEEGC